MTVKNIYPWGNFVLDDATGLPLLPEPNLFYRVGRSTLGFWKVELRRRHKLWVSTEVSRRTYDSSTALTADNILRGAAYCLCNVPKKVRKDNSLIGDYPPKKLES